VSPASAGRLLAAVQRRRRKQLAVSALLRQQETRLAELDDALRNGETHKAEFLSTMSHELRTPLNVVLGFASLIYDEAFGALNQQQLEACGKVLESAERLTQLINDLLDAAKLDRGQLTFRVGEIDLAELAACAVELAQPLASQKGLELRLELRLELPESLPRISADGDRLAQVLGHLLDNAVKFTATGGQLGLRVSAEPGAPTVLVEVWDTGIGIPREAHARLFDRFYQVDSSNTREYGGTGIGLAIVREFVERLGGEVAVVSEVGKGSTFKLALPVAPSAPSEQLVG